MLEKAIEMHKKAVTARRATGGACTDTDYQ
jgi:hypothetical protein